jgi:protein-S-isoprenylcysteine O-methyltransferase Ste14
MALIEELSIQGNKLFKYRSSLPIPFALVGITIYLYHIHFLEKNEHSLEFEIACLLIGLAGQIIRAITLGHTPKGTSGRNTKKQVAEELNTKGMYSIVRNPLYLGNYFMWLSLIIFIDIHWFTVFYIMCFWIYYERIIFAEEKFLIEKYGKPYLEWTTKTPIFFPRLYGWEKPLLPFSFKNVLKREYSGFFALFLCFSIFNMAENIVREEDYLLDSFWTYAILISGSLSFTLKILKKYTKILTVSGR